MYVFKKAMASWIVPTHGQVFWVSPLWRGWPQLSMMDNSLLKKENWGCILGRRTHRGRECEALAPSQSASLGAATHTPLWTAKDRDSRAKKHQASQRLSRNDKQLSHLVREWSKWICSRVPVYCWGWRRRPPDAWMSTIVRDLGSGPVGGTVDQVVNFIGTSASVVNHTLFVHLKNLYH